MCGAVANGRYHSLTIYSPKRAFVGTIQQMTTNTYIRNRVGGLMSGLLLAAMLLVWLLGQTPSATSGERSVAAAPAIPVASPIISPSYGINFISFARATPLSDTRYQNGLATGAQWNRWPMYWNDIEQADGVFAWAYQDVVAATDMISYGLQVNAILLGTPPFYTTTPAGLPPSQAVAEGTLALDAATAATPVGLYDPIFNDSSDVPGVGKQINPANKWARFVFTAVSRYKPGGVLAQQQGWPAGVGITHWEMWNEPDLGQFWDGTVADYARLLKVGYLAAKQADPNAQILFGGLANPPANLTFYNDVMALLDGDAMAASYGYFHDILATHNYLYAWEAWYHVWRAGRTLANRGLSKPIWLNENGVPVWDDYPGPVCEPDSSYRATMTEQADYIVQSGLYATYAGADMLYFFQLYDDCGNVGGNHAWYSADTCSDAVIEPGGDAFGLYRNPADPLNYCYTHHPTPETARPGFDAYRLMTDYFRGVEPLWRDRRGDAAACGQWALGSQEWLAFFKPETGERVLGLWALCRQNETAVIPTTSAAGTALLLSPDGTTQPITATNGVFTLSLPAATNQNAPWDPEFSAIGGRPYLLIEADTLPPELTVLSPVTAVADIALSWSASDLGSGVVGFDVRVAVDGGAAQPWLLDTQAESGSYAGQPGHVYTFTVAARDKAGNVAETAVTVRTITLDKRTYLPVIVDG